MKTKLIYKEGVVYTDLPSDWFRRDRIFLPRRDFASVSKVADEIIELFRTRKFTIVTHSRGEYSIYVGRYFNYGDLPEEADYHIACDGIDDNGYIPAIVGYLVEALGGITNSI